MRPALLLVDLQEDFLEREGLSPDRDSIVSAAADLLASCRARGVPVFHCRTLYRADGADRMPHRRRTDARVCVEGTPGARPPAPLEPIPGEPVFFKRFYDAFADPSLEPALRNAGVDTLLVAGLYLDACVRTTVLAAYERGFAVRVAEDAAGSTAPEHAETCRIWLEDRAATFFSAGADAGADEVRETCAAAARARGAATDVPRLLARWAAELEARADQLADLMAEEIGKPVRDGRREIRFALSLLGHAAAPGPGSSRLAEDPPVAVRSRPHGVVGVVTPWNNPVAIPVGKIAPALAFGNAAVWKPAPEAPLTTAAVLDALDGAGGPAGLVGHVAGGGTAARRLADDPNVRAVTFTGSPAAGRALAVRCARHGKPFQAELGGNNAAVVLADWPFEDDAPRLARAAFAFAGQRCTAVRRFVVERAIAPRFTEALAAAAAALRIGDPRNPETDLGPLVSAAHRDRVLRAIGRAVASGARVVGGGGPPPGLPDGAWLAPTLLADVRPDARIAREETFGPVAVILPFDDLDEAIRIANGVEQGLVAAVLTRDPAARRRLADSLEAGILSGAAGPLAVHAAAPFSGWKASAFGPAEHGRWDGDFHARPQALYDLEDFAC